MQRPRRINSSFPGAEDRKSIISSLKRITITTIFIVAETAIISKKAKKHIRNAYRDQVYKSLFRYREEDGDGDRRKSTHKKISASTRIPRTTAIVIIEVFVIFSHPIPTYFHYMHFYGYVNEKKVF